MASITTLAQTRRPPLPRPLALIATLALGLLCTLAAAAITGCAARGPTAAAPEAVLAPFVLVYLKSGPTSGSGTPDERRAMFAGHMANMQRLATEEKLIVAGPFGTPRDRTWRGLQLFDVPSVAEARTLAATDPGVVAGEFIAECVPLRASPALRQTLRLERELTARLEAERGAAGAAPSPRAPGAPPPNIRAYVLVHAADVDRALAALTRTPGSARVVWAARVEGPDARGRAGVFVLDAEKADDAAALLERAGAGACDVDGWWSTVSLLGLPPEAARV